MQNYWKFFDIQPPYGLLRCNLHRNVKLASCSLKYAQLPSCSSKEHISAYLSTRLKERTETRKLVKTSRFSAEVNLCHLWESWNPGIYLIIPFFQMFLFVGDNVVSIAFKMTTAQVSVLEIFFSSPWNLLNRENWYHVWYDNAFAPLIWTQ